MSRFELNIWMSLAIFCVAGIFFLAAVQNPRKEPEISLPVNDLRYCFDELCSNDFSIVEQHAVGNRTWLVSVWPYQYLVEAKDLVEATQTIEQALQEQYQIEKPLIKYTSVFTGQASPL